MSRRSATFRLRASLVAFVVASVIIGAGSQLVRSPAQELADRRPPPARPLTAALRPGPLRWNLRLTCDRSPATVVEVPRTSVAEGVVTEVPLRAGAAVIAGKAVVEINGRPVIALATDYPFYRRLRSGDVGRDVAALGKALGVAGHDDSATLDDGLLGKLSRLYDGAGYQAPRQQALDPSLPASAIFDPAEVVSIGSAPMVVTRVPERGAQASAGALQMASKSAQLRCELPGDVTDLAAGTRGTVDGAIPAVIDAVVAADPGASGSGGSDTARSSVALVHLGADEDGGRSTGPDIFEVERSRGGPADLLAPSSAVYEAADGSAFVLLASGTPAGSERRAPVQVRAVDHGFVLLGSADARVHRGATVVVGAKR